MGKLIKEEPPKKNPATHGISPPPPKSQIIKEITDTICKKDKVLRVKDLFPPNE